jgi:CBS domain-containing protein
MNAQDLMTPDPATIPANAKLRDAVEILQNLDVRHLPVIDDEGELVGMLSDRDLRGLALPHLVGGEYAGVMQTGLQATVATVMSSNVLSVDPETEVDEIVELMLENKIGAVPVVDRDRGLIGIVSYMDVLRNVDLH